MVNLLAGLSSWAPSPSASAPWMRSTALLDIARHEIPFLPLKPRREGAWLGGLADKINPTIAIAAVIVITFFAMKSGYKIPSWMLLAPSKQEFISKGVSALGNVPLLRKIWPLAGDFQSPIPTATYSALKNVKGIGGGLSSKLNPLNWLKYFNKAGKAKQEDDEKYQAGEPYGDPPVLSSSLVDDLKSVGLKAGVKDIETLVGMLKSKVKPMDDRQMIMEKAIAIVAALPRNSMARKKLTGVIIDGLWGSLQHPPLTYMGDKFQYRMPDGSYNNPLQPELGKAGTAYARSVPSKKTLHGVEPDPGLLFDLLMARTEDTFKENPAGISSVLFYHAAIIIHDIFRTNRLDSNISDTSSYLDLAPLYGSSLDDQLKIRTLQRGLLKPDTFHERRLLGQPPGVNVMLVMYSRFHNYVADVLLKINENGRFTLPPTISDEERDKALAKQDNDLFQTARLITCGLYINISLHDYLRGLTNTHHSASDWTLDPRIAVDKFFDPEGIPRGVGNQVSAEFNLLYRFHSTISKRDEKWLNDFLASIFPDTTKPLDQLTPQEFLQGLFRFEKSIPDDPAQRVFAGLTRDGNGKFSDADLVRIMKESMEDPAGLFGPRMVPKALKIVEITGILTARKWHMASLNEMRDFFKLKRHETFEDVNPDPAIADLLRKLYDHPDMVEMYPGMFLEDAKPRMDPGCGGCPPYTVGRAVFSDAVTLVRSDRLYTLDYTAASLTNWGIKEVQQDYDVMGGSMFYKLFQRTVPNWFPYNSLHIMQPMFTRNMNEQIAKEIGTIDQYSSADPAPPRRPVVVAKHSVVKEVLRDQANFRVPWAHALNDMSGKDYSSFMLGADKPANTAQRNLVKDIMFGPEQFNHLLASTAFALSKDLLHQVSVNLSKSLDQVDIVRDVAIPLNARIVGDLFSLDLKSADNKNGSLGTSKLYKCLLDVRTWGFNNNDPAMAWQRRMWARQGAEILTQSTVKAIRDGSGGMGQTLAKTMSSMVKRLPVIGALAARKQEVSAQGSTASLRWYGAQVVNELLAAGKTVEEIADICWLSAVAGVGAPVGVFTDVLSFFLKAENNPLWASIQDIAASADDDAATKQLRQCVLEAQRLTSTQRNARICVSNVTVGGQQFSAGDNVVCLFGPACKDPDAVPDPQTFRLDRPADAYLHFGYGPHECLGKEICTTMVVALVRAVAQLKNVRPAIAGADSPKSITIGTERGYLNDSWSTLTFDPTTWKLHFEGYGTGTYKAPSAAVPAAAHDLNAVSNVLVRQDKEGGPVKELKPAAQPDGLVDPGMQKPAVAAPITASGGSMTAPLPDTSPAPAAAYGMAPSSGGLAPPETGLAPLSDGIDGPLGAPGSEHDWFFGPDSAAGVSKPIPAGLA